MDDMARLPGIDQFSRVQARAPGRNSSPGPGLDLHQTGGPGNHQSRGRIPRILQKSGRGRAPYDGAQFMGVPDSAAGFRWCRTKDMAELWRANRRLATPPPLARGSWRESRPHPESEHPRLARSSRETALKNATSGSDWFLCSPYPYSGEKGYPPCRHSGRGGLIHSPVRR